MTDPIGNIIVRIKNAVASNRDSVVFPSSKKTIAVAEVLERLGYIAIVPKKSKKAYKQIEAKIVYINGKPRFKGADRVSIISKRVYKKIKNIIPVKSGFGSLVLSTPKGLLSEREAGKEKVGGEALFEIW